MQLPENTKNIKEVLKVIYDIPDKMLVWALEPEKFDKWIESQSKTLGFDFSEFI